MDGIEVEVIEDYQRSLQRPETRVRIPYTQQNILTTVR